VSNRRRQRLRGHRTRSRRWSPRSTAPGCARLR